MPIHKLTTLIAVFLFSLSSVYAQPAQSQAGRITAVLLDSDSEEGLPFATVSLVPAGAKKPSQYVLSTSEGVVTVENVKSGDYKFKVELMGYKTFVTDVKVGKGTVDLGEIKVDPDRKVLDAAKVSDVGNPIVIKKDTIEYNASSFKTTDNDMLLDLLKKLPGIEVGSDGTVTANGETIKKITIEGKTFFLDDPQLATKNIPSKIIEKVKVVEKKSDQAMFTGIDDGEEETIIDLSIKKGMFKGWFGNVMGGGGHDIPSKNNDMNDWRYQGAAFVGNFTKNQQISGLLNINNTNNRGFNDLAGSMMGNMRGGGGRGMGRKGDVGITTSWMAGLNGAWTLLDKKMDLGANYLYNGSDKYVGESTLKNTFVNDKETLNYLNTGTNRTSAQGHRFGIRLEHKFSDNTSILFEPRFNFGNGSYSERSVFNTTRSLSGDEHLYNVNDGFSDNLGWNKNWTASGWGLFRQKLGKPGRTMTINFRYDFSQNKLNGYNQSIQRTYDELEEPKDTTITNQRFDQNENKSMVSAGLTYTEPITENWFIEANYNYTWRDQNSFKDTYNSGSNVITGQELSDKRLVYDFNGEKRADNFCNTIYNTSHAHKAGANVMYQKKKFNAQLGFTLNPTQTYNYTNGKEYSNKVLNWAPQASLRYDMNDNSNIRMFYRGDSEQPSTSQLMPVPDNSDPNNISLGNPYLIPYFNHRLRAMYRYTNKKTFTSVNAYLQGNIVQNPIINTSWYDNDGVQFSLPSNGTTSANVNLRCMVNSPIAKSKFSIFSMTRLAYNNSTNFVKTGNLDMSKYYIGGDKYNFNYELFHQDFPSLMDRPDVFSANLTQTMTWVQRLRGTYRDDLVEAVLGYRVNMNKSWYAISSRDNLNPQWAQQAEASLNFTIPSGTGIVAQCEYNWYVGYTTEQPSSCILNAEISQQFYKKKFTIALKGYDLLGQSRNIDISDKDNYHEETRNNTLGRYVILSLTYRFGTFNKDAMGKGMGPGRGHGGPGGPGGPGFGGRM